MRLRHAAELIGSPSALLLTIPLLASGIAWNYSEQWWLWLDRIVYMATLWIALVVQAAQNRDTAAMHRKLDELIRSIDKADDRLQGLEKE